MDTQNKHGHKTLYLTLIFLFGAGGLLIYALFFIQSHKPPRQIIYPSTSQTNKTSSNSFQQKFLKQITSFPIENKQGLVTALKILSDLNTGSMSAELKKIEEETLRLAQNNEL